MPLLSPSEIPADLAALLRLVPGYDPLATAEDSKFDTEAAELAIAFFPECLRHVEGAVAGKPFVLQPWQQAIVANLFGWKRMDAAGRLVRRYRQALVYVPRKNGKTPLVAGIALLVLFCDKEAGQQDYIAAGEREQAAMLFRHCRGMVEAEPYLSERCSIYGGAAAGGQSKSIVKPDNSFLRVISADASTKHGGNSHLVVIDELHVQPNRDLVDVLRTSMASANRPQPLLIYVTTSDFSRPSICNEVHDHACKVRDGLVPDVAFLPVIYEAGIDEDWTSPEVWARVNPNIGVSVSEEYLRAECAKAKENPALENVFRRLHLNTKTETDVRAIDMSRWDACPSDIPDLEGRECYAGLDLSTTTDISAFVLLFPLDGGRYAVQPHFWIPREGARQRERRDRVPYETWLRQGYIYATEGNSIDYDVIRAKINELGQVYRITSIMCDRWNSSQLVSQLMGDGFDVVAFGQGFRDMTSPTKELLRLVVEGKLLHGGQPTLKWMASNMATESDAAGNLKPSKKKSTERIDGMVALIMALGKAMVSGESDWYQPGILRD